MFYWSQKYDTIRAFYRATCSCKMYRERGELSVSKKYDQPENAVGSILRDMREESGMTRERVSERTEIGLRHLCRHRAWREKSKRQHTGPAGSRPWCFC